MSARSKRTRHQAIWTMQALGPDGWAVAERFVDHPSPMILEDVAEQLRALVRVETGWTPTVRLLDPRGRDVSARYELD
jgi:hypothetical protein